MSKKNRSKIDSDKAKMIANTIAGLYIDNGRKMPSKRQIKKCPFISTSEYNEAKQDYSQLFSEKAIRELIYGKNQDEAPKAVEKEAIIIEARIEPSEKASALSGIKGKSTESSISREESSLQGRKRGRKAITREEALADLRALKGRLGHIPSTAEINDPRNGAKYSLATYVSRIGPKRDWASEIGE